MTVPFDETCRVHRIPVASGRAQRRRRLQAAKAAVLRRFHEWLQNPKGGFRRREVT